MRSAIKFTIVIVLSFIILSFYFNRGLTYYDEGFISHSTQRLNAGESPYKDFRFVYMPLSLYILSFTYKIFGESILSGRILTYFFHILTILFIFQITQKITSKFKQQLIPILIFLAWTPSHVNFSWPVVFFLSISYLSIFLYEKYLQNHKNYLLFFVGILAGISFLIKQNFGVALIISILTILILYTPKSKLISIISYLIGIFVVILLFVFILIQKKIFSNFIYEFYFVSIKKIILEGVLSTKFFYGYDSIYKISKNIFYLLPLFISLLSIYLIIKKNKKQNKHLHISLSSFSFYFYILAIRPTTDFVHLSPILSTLGFPLLTILLLINNKIFKFITYFWIFILIFLGFYTSIFWGYNRWGIPLIQNNFYLKYPKVNLWVDEGQYNTIPKVVEYIQSNTDDGSYIFVPSFDPLFYFLAKRKNPTIYTDQVPNNLPIDLQKSVVDSLKEKNVVLVLSDKPLNIFNNDGIEDYISDNFKKIVRINEFIIWTR